MRGMKWDGMKKTWLDSTQYVKIRGFGGGLLCNIKNNKKRTDLFTHLEILGILESICFVPICVECDLTLVKHKSNKKEPQKDFICMPLCMCVWERELCCTNVQTKTFFLHKNYELSEFLFSCWKATGVNLRHHQNNWEWLR